MENDHTATDAAALGRGVLINVSTLTNVTISTTNNASDCVVIHYENYPPWEDPANLISAEAEEVVRWWKDTVILPVLFLIGGPANVINMAVFYKQGLKERINVCLFALSLADFLYLFVIIVFVGENIGSNRTDRFGQIATFMWNHNLVGLYGVAWVSFIMSALIASERCFCVLQPLRSQTILRTSTTTAIIIAVYVGVVGLYFLVMTRYRVLCVFDPVEEVTYLELMQGDEFYLDNKQLIDYLDVFVYGVGLPGLVMTVVATTTIVTTIKLGKAAAWRAEISSSSSTSSSSTSSKGMSAKEVALTKMLIGTSILFLACVSPNVFFRMSWLLLPEISPGGRQHNMFLVHVWFMDVVSWTNSSVNFFIYYTMGTRYRATLWALLGRDCRGGTAGGGTARPPVTISSDMD